MLRGQKSTTHLACVWRASVRGRPCSPCDGCRKPLHTSADALIPTLMALRVVLPTPPTMSGAARVGAEGGADAVRQHGLMARVGIHAPSVTGVRVLPESSSHVVRCIRS